MKNIKALFIDLDGTIYDRHIGLEQRVIERMQVYFRDILYYPEHKILPVMETYYQKHGSTLRGIQMNHDIDPDEYLAFVHDVDYHSYLSPDPNLRYILQSIPLPKWILTNSDRNHTERVLNIMGLEGLFVDIIDVWAMDYLPKPDSRVYDRALQIAGGLKACESMFFDDTIKNLRPAWYKGFTTALVGSSKKQPFATYSLATLHEIEEIDILPQAVPQQMTIQELMAPAEIYS